MGAIPVSARVKARVIQYQSTFKLSFFNMSSKTEAGKNPNYCSWCDVACGTRTGLKEHMTTVHGVVYNELQTYVLGIKRKSESDPNEVQCSPEKRRKTMDR